MTEQFYAFCAVGEEVSVLEIPLLAASSAAALSLEQAECTRSKVRQSIQSPAVVLLLSVSPMLDAQNTVRWAADHSSTHGSFTTLAASQLSAHPLNPDPALTGMVRCGLCAALTGMVRCGPCAALEYGPL
jgi:hypothetical protein